MHEFANARERAAVVGVRLPGVDPGDLEDFLDELTALAASAEVEVCAKVLQSRTQAVPATFVGSGKVDEIRGLVEREDLNVVIFDDELSPSQVRNLEDRLGVKVITRTELILDIFARKARTYESKIQVEVAQLEYRLNRIAGKGVLLSRLGGGVGTRGPGEQKLEVDRRRIRERISMLRSKLDKIGRRRTVQRSGRLGFPVGAVVGYTNVGKSTLINRISSSELHTEDRLFATLDATTRRVELGHGKKVLLTDTVGFIRKFPPQLAASFRSTIEEALEADFLVHVADAAHPRLLEQIKTVENFLGEMGAGGKPTLRVLNKVDLLEKALPVQKKLDDPFGWIGVSARTGGGMSQLKSVLREKFSRAEG